MWDFLAQIGFDFEGRLSVAPLAALQKTSELQGIDMVLTSKRTIRGTHVGKKFFKVSSVSQPALRAWHIPTLEVV